MSSVFIENAGLSSPMWSYLGTDLSISQLDKFHCCLFSPIGRLPWSFGTAPSMSFVCKFMLALLPEINLLVVVFIKSFSLLMTDKLIKSHLFGITKLNGSLKDGAPAAGIASVIVPNKEVVIYYFILTNKFENMTTSLFGTITEAMPAAGAPSLRDPFNFVMPNRCDLMSLSVINKEKDLMKTTTSKFISGRSASMNLHTKDIDGAVPKLHGNRPIGENKQQWNLSNWDIDRSVPR
jgi:hypothetical protein